MKKVAVMQPYFFPYLGYFQLIKASDIFVIYDNIEFTKKGWFNRNRLVFNKKIEYFTVNIQKDSDYLDVRERKIAPIFFQKEKYKILRKIKNSYKKYPYYDSVIELIEEIFNFEDSNLFNYLYNSITLITKYLEIDTQLVVSSSLNINHQLKNKYKIWSIMDSLSASCYINPYGGHDLYEKKEFEQYGIQLEFLKMKETVDWNQPITPKDKYLSIIDLLMSKSLEDVKIMLDEYDFVAL